MELANFANACSIFLCYFGKVAQKQALLNAFCAYCTLAILCLRCQPNKSERWHHGGSGFWLVGLIQSNINYLATTEAAKEQRASHTQHQAEVPDEAFVRGRDQRGVQVSRSCIKACIDARAGFLNGAQCEGRA